MPTLPQFDVGDFADRSFAAGGKRCDFCRLHLRVRRREQAVVYNPAPLHFG